MRTAKEKILHSTLPNCLFQGRRQCMSFTSAAPGKCGRQQVPGCLQAHLAKVLRYRQVKTTKMEIQAMHVTLAHPGEAINAMICPGQEDLSLCHLRSPKTTLVITAQVVFEHSRSFVSPFSRNTRYWNKALVRTT